jgi:hypothetical protein
MLEMRDVPWTWTGRPLSATDSNHGTVYDANGLAICQTLAWQDAESIVFLRNSYDRLKTIEKAATAFRETSPADKGEKEQLLYQILKEKGDVR